MKTRDAFALRGVEEKFSFLGMIGKMLAKCGLSVTALQKLDADREDFDDMQRARQKYFSFLGNLQDFRRRIIRHNDRLLKFGMMTLKSNIDNKPRDKRLADLSDRYTAIARKLIEAEETVDGIIYNLDCYQRQYCTKIFAERLKQARIKKKLSRQQLAESIGVSRNGYGSYETGRREPNLFSLIRLSKILGVTTDWLVGITP